MKSLVMCSLFFMLFLSGGKVDKFKEFENITDSFKHVTKINISIENMQTFLNKGDEKFEVVLRTLLNVTEYAHDMPAFGVSLDDLTKEEMKTGLWVELEFDKTYSFNEMPFDALLIKVEKDIYGFNLIRRNNGKYDGRCFYLSLHESMNDLFNLINKMYK